MRKAAAVLLSLALVLPFSALSRAASASGTGREDGARVFSSVSVGDKIIALTFDDGPHPSQTEKILDVLSVNGVKATFFVIGENAEKRPELVRKIVDGGHEIGNHTYDHKPLRRRTEDEIADEIKRAEDALLEAGGGKPRLLRPPEGKYSEKVVNEAEKLGLTVVLWSVDTRDWAHRSADSIVRTVTENVSSGDIILFHDFISGESHTAEALEILLPRLREEGYSFVTVSELISLRDK